MQKKTKPKRKQKHRKNGRQIFLAIELVLLFTQKSVRARIQQELVTNPEQLNYEILKQITLDDL